MTQDLKEMPCKFRIMQTKVIIKWQSNSPNASEKTADDWQYVKEYNSTFCIADELFLTQP